MTSSWFQASRRTIAIAAVAVAVNAAPELEARPPDATHEDSSEPRMTQEVSLSIDVGKRRIHVELDREDAFIHLRHAGTAVESRPLHGDRTLDHHVLRVQTASAAQSSGDEILWAEIAPVPDTGSPGDPTFHVAWHISRASDGTWRWKHVARTRHSTLDGGQRLVLQQLEEAKGARLIREEVEPAETWCRGAEQPPWSLESYRPRRGRFEVTHRRDHYLERARSLRARWPDAPLEGPFTRGVYRWAHLEDDSTSPETGTRVLGDRQGSTHWSMSPRQLGRTYATARTTTAIPVKGVRIVPGAASSPDVFEQHPAPESLLMTFSDGTIVHVEWPDELTYERLVEKRGVVVSLPNPIRTRCMSIVPLGDEGNSKTVALSEVTPVTSLDARTRAATAARLVERIRSTDNQERRRRLARLGSVLGEALEKELENVLNASNDNTHLQQIVPLIEQLSDTRAAPLLVRLLKSMERRAPAYRQIHRTLGHLGSSATEPLLGWLETLSIEDDRYADVLQTLGAIGSREALAPQIRELGRGSRSLRRARIRAISSGGRALLEPLFEMLREHQDIERRRDTLVAIHAIGRQLEGKPPHSHAEAGALFALLRTTKTRRLLLHGLRAATWFELEDMDSTPTTRLLSSDDPLVRRAALSALRYASTQNAPPYWLEALRDPSPDVRLEALDILSQHSGRDEEILVEPLIEYVRRASTWPRGERRAFEILADIESKRTDQFFEEILVVASDHPDRTLRAVEALIHSGRFIASTTVRAIAANRDLALELREKALTLLGFGATREGEQYLLDVAEGALQDGRRGSSADEPELRHRAMLALGRRQSDEARDRLWSILRTHESKAMRRHALRALARYRDRDMIEALQNWRSAATLEIRSRLDRTIRRMRERLSPADTPDVSDSSRPSP